MANFTITVGPSGRSFTTLQAAWISLPATVPVGDAYTITMAAGLYTTAGTLDVYANPKTISGTVLIKPETGASWWEVFAAGNRPLAYDNTRGVAIEAGPFLKDVLVLQGGVSVEGLQIKPTGNSPAISWSGTSTATKNIIVMGAGTGAALRGDPGVLGSFTNNVVITTSTTVAPINISDETGRTFDIVGNTIIAPNGGAGDWFKGDYSNGVRPKDNAIFGFTVAASTHIDTANSSNNATDLATLYGTNNVLSLSAANQFVNTTLATLDLRLKAGNALTGAGVTSALIPIDAYGIARSAPPAIGAVDSVTSGPATVNLAVANLSSANTLTTASVTVTPPVAGVVNLAAANMSSGATLATAAVGVVPVTGTLTSDIFKAWGSPAALAGITVPRVVALKLDGTVALNLAAQVTNGAGRIVLVSASLVAGTAYMLATWNADGSARGLKAYTAT